MHRVVQGADVTRLLTDVRAHRVEVRGVEHVGRVLGDLGEQGLEVRVPAVDGLFVRDRPAQGFEVGLEAVRQALRVRALVVDRHRRLRAQLLVREVRVDGRLDAVVVRGTEVVVLVRPLGGERRVRRRGRDDDDALVGEELVGDPERGARAAGPDHADDLGVGAERRLTLLTAVGRTPVALVHELHVVSEDLAVRAVEGAVEVVDRELHPVQAVEPEVLVGARGREQRADLDRRPCGDRHAPGCRVAVDRAAGCARTAGGPARATVVVVVRTGARDERESQSNGERRERGTTLHGPPFRFFLQMWVVWYHIRLPKANRHVWPATTGYALRVSVGWAIGERARNGTRRRARAGPLGRPRAAVP